MLGVVIGTQRQGLEPRQDFAASLDPRFRDQVRLQLQSQPDRVRVFLNGVSISGDKPIETPASLIIPAGRHTIRISAEGFMPSVTSVEGFPGDTISMESVVLERLPKTTPELDQNQPIKDPISPNSLKADPLTPAAAAQPAALDPKNP